MKCKVNAVCNIPFKGEGKQRFKCEEKKIKIFAVITLVALLCCLRLPPDNLQSLRNLQIIPQYLKEDITRLLQSLRNYRGELLDQLLQGA